MTSKADVLAARTAYERVAEAYLQERGWISSDNHSWPWTKPGYTAAGYKTAEAVMMELSKERCEDCGSLCCIKDEQGYCTTKEPTDDHES